MKSSVLNCIEMGIMELKSEIKRKEGTELAVEIPDDMEELKELEEEADKGWREVVA